MKGHENGSRVGASSGFAGRVGLSGRTATVLGLGATGGVGGADGTTGGCCIVAVIAGTVSAVLGICASAESAIVISWSIRCIRLSNVSAETAKESAEKLAAPNTKNARLSSLIKRPRILLHPTVATLCIRRKRLFNSNEKKF